MTYLKKKIYKNILQGRKLSKICPFKICVVAKNRTILRQIDSDAIHYCEASEKRCGYVAFFYFDKLSLALELRNKLYSYNNLYVFLQDDRNIL